MYTVLDYARMASDPVRMDAYERAIARVVKPGDVVVDIGAGTGILSLIAARAGAAHVHAIEPNPAIFLLADIAAANGVGDRITIHRRPSFDVELPKPADVILSDLRGSFPLYEEHLPIIRDARTRLLRKGGTLIPARDRLFVGVVESHDIWRKLAGGWEAFSNRGIEAGAARRALLNETYGDGSAPLSASAMLTPGIAWSEIDYRENDAELFDANVTTAIQRGGTAHGLALWFEATLDEGIHYSNAPGTSLVYSRLFLPLLEPVAVKTGDAVSIAIHVDARATRWAWDTEIAGTRFRQSTFLGQPIDAATLLREARSFRPERSERGEKMRRLLDSMDGTRNVDELIAASALSLGDVREAVARYAR